MTSILLISPLILLAATGAVWMPRPVHAALFLALSLALNAVLYLVLGADFIGLVQFMVYVGGISVLIVFSLLITRGSDEFSELARRTPTLAAGLACVLPVFGLLVVVVARAASCRFPELKMLPLDRLGRVLFSTHAPAVLAVAVLLTSVMIGAALLARSPDRPNRSADP